MEWWTYTLSDFVMFSPQVYARLVARYNEAAWPAQLAGIAGGLALLTLAARRDSPQRPLWPALLLAAAWACSGWAFHWSRYAEIFLAAPWLAAASGLQAVLLAGCAALRPRQGFAPTPTRVAGLALIAAATLLHPLADVVAGAGWARAEVVGLMPDPTALATLGWLLATRALPGAARAVLAVLPLLALLLGVLTRVALAQ